MNSISESQYNSHISKSIKSFPDVIKIDGIKLTKKEEAPSLDVFVIVGFGTQIPKLAWELQKKIHDDIKEELGAEIEEINIHIEGVSL